MNEQPAPHHKARRTEQRAMVLLILGVVLLLPPMAGIFQIDAKIGGVPVTLVYLFLVWAGLIAVAARLSRRLSATDDGPDRTS